MGWWWLGRWSCARKVRAEAAQLSLLLFAVGDLFRAASALSRDLIKKNKAEGHSVAAVSWGGGPFPELPWDS